jgi:hypothetical protein
VVEHLPGKSEALSSNKNKRKRHYANKKRHYAKVGNKAEKDCVSFSPLFLFFFETGSCYVAQAGLEFSIPQAS